MKAQKVLVDAQYIEAQAKRIRDIAQAIIDACQSGQSIEPYARAKVASGSLAQDAAVLGIMLVQHEMGEE
jgi:hypothetical protein